MARRLLAALAAIVALTLASAVSAQTAPGRASSLKVFAAVDSVEIQGTRVVIRGVLQGDAAASGWYVQQSYSGDFAASAQFADSCQRAALLVMAKPGQYVLEILDAGSYYSSVCRIVRAVQ